MDLADALARHDPGYEADDETEYEADKTDDETDD
jgi:hypothetical protein